MKDTAAKAWEQTKDSVKQGANELKRSGSRNFEEAKDDVKSAARHAKADLKGAKHQAEGVAENVKEAASNAWEKAKDVADNVKENVKEQVQAPGGLKDKAANAWETVKDKVQDAASEVKHKAGDLKDKAQQAVHDATEPPVRVVDWSIDWLIWMAWIDVFSRSIDWECSNWLIRSTVWLSLYVLQKSCLIESLIEGLRLLQFINLLDW